MVSINTNTTSVPVTVNVPIIVQSTTQSSINMTSSLSPGVAYRDYMPSMFEYRPPFRVGDTVRLVGRTDSGGIVYRITNISNAVDAVRGHYIITKRTWKGPGRGSTKSSNPIPAWVYRNKNGRASARKVPWVRLDGCVELTPVLCLLPGTVWSARSKKTISLRNVESYVKKVDLVEFGKLHLQLQQFLTEEVKRYTEKDDDDSKAR